MRFQPRHQRHFKLAGDMFLPIRTASLATVRFPREVTDLSQIESDVLPRQIDRVGESQAGVIGQARYRFTPVRLS